MSIVPQNLRLQPPDASPAIQPPTIDIVGDGDPGTAVDQGDGTVMIPLEDGGVIIDFNPLRPGGQNDNSKDDHDANLAEFIFPAELGAIASELMTGIQADDQSRQEWIDMRAQGIRLLGLTLNSPKSDVTASAAGVEGQSTVQHPMLLEATLRFQANARGELLPSQGPVKVSTAGLADGVVQDAQAEALENDLNYFLTKVATEYIPDTDRMLFYVGFSGCMFKKVYNCPIRRRPVSESVDAADLIVSNAITDMGNSARITHVIRMKQSMLKRMQIVGAYRDVPIGMPPYQAVRVDREAVATQQGVQPMPQNPADQEYELYECLCELDIMGYQHMHKGKPSGLKLPYRVVLEKNSGTVFEVRRNWDPDDDMCLPRSPFVKFPFVPGLGFYDIGLVHILGNTTNAITAAWREMLDAGMFANFPGFLYARAAGRQLTNTFRVPPGGGVPIETNGQDIGKMIMPLPYKDISPSFAQFVDHIEQTGSRVGGTAEINVGEGNQEAPVGTTLALIEQATKVQDAVHKRLHAAQAEEFGKLKQCFRADPGAFLRSARKNGAVKWDEQTFVDALNNADLVPQADPNTPSHMHRLMKVMAIKQLQAASPTLYDAKAVDVMVLQMIGVKDFQALFTKAPPSAQPPDPKLIGTMVDAKTKLAQTEAQTQGNLKALQVKAAIADRQSSDQAKDRESEERIEAMRLSREMIVHKADVAQGQAELEMANRSQGSQEPGATPFST